MISTIISPALGVTSLALLVSRIGQLWRDLDVVAGHTTGDLLIAH
jgi:hypothetical protein